ncbi:hypothetical protein [Nocardioides campestrisoli]|uniref:hypothetical protein n=1 Tax=Nocardioides campestrisoli TaxID=2736757 RepID=UPI00163DB526|nr:hypothetical protein [Nocardioides campestrisoli]
MTRTGWRPEPWWIPAGLAVGLIAGALFPTVFLVPFFLVEDPTDWETGLGVAVVGGAIGAPVGAALGLVLGVVLCLVGHRGLTLRAQRRVAAVTALVGTGAAAALLVGLQEATEPEGLLWAGSRP